jgi:ABC-type sugar transport system permease subunit
MTELLSSTTLSPKPKAPHPHAGLRRREASIGLLFLSPWILGYILLKVLPILTALWYSLTDFQMAKPNEIHFVGLTNYLRFLTDLDAWSNMAGSLGYFLTTVPFELLVALALAAVFTSARLRGKNFLRPVIFMTSIIPVASIIFIYFGLVDPQTGWINLLIMQPLGLPPLAQGPSLYYFLLTLMSLWGIGPGFLIMLGAMQAIPKELHEAARVDGAGPLTRFLKITIPIISPAIFFSVVINLTSAFGGSMLLDRGYAASGGLAPMEGYINEIMYQHADVGYSAALTWVMFAVMMAITIMLFRSAQRWVYFPEEGEHESF